MYTYTYTRIRDISRISVSRWKIHVAETTMKRKRETESPITFSISGHVELSSVSLIARRLALVLIINARSGQVAFLSNATLSLYLHPPHLLFSYATNPVRGPYAPGCFARRVHYTLRYCSSGLNTRRVSRVASIKLQKISRHSHLLAIDAIMRYSDWCVATYPFWIDFTDKMNERVCCVVITQITILGIFLQCASCNDWADWTNYIDTYNAHTYICENEWEMDNISIILTLAIYACNVKMSLPDVIIVFN